MGDQQQVVEPLGEERPSAEVIPSPVAHHTNRPWLRALWLAILPVLAGAIWAAIKAQVGEFAIDKGRALLLWVLSLPRPLSITILFVIALLLALAVKLTVEGLLARRAAAKHTREEVEEQARRVKEHIRQEQESYQRIIDIRAIVQVLLMRVEQNQAQAVTAPFGLPRATTFVGRDREWKELRAHLLEGGAAGVFALNGIAGVGKTALAAEVVASFDEDREHFPGGSAWISCEGLRGSEGLFELWARVARALGFPTIAQLDPEARRAAMTFALAEKPRSLLALDNVEEQLDVEAVLATLSIPGHTSLLITARHAIVSKRLVAALELEPLETRLAEGLLIQRLKLLTKGQRPTSQDMESVPPLIAEIGGNPRVIELTAAYVAARRQPLAEIVGARASVVPAALERSWQVLSQRQQLLFSGLALLNEASFSRRAASLLSITSIEDTGIGGSHIPSNESDDFDALLAYALVEPLAGSLFRLLPESRAFAEAQWRRLPLSARHRLCQAVVAYSGQELKAAHDQGNHLRVLQLARALSYSWNMWGSRRDLHLMLEWAEVAANELNVLAERRWVAQQLGALAMEDEDYAASLKWYEEARNLATQQVDGETYILAAEQGLAEVALRQRDYTQARKLLTRVLSRANRLQDVDNELFASHLLGRIDFEEEAYDDAVKRFEYAWRLAAEIIKDPDAEALELRWLGLANARNARDMAELRTARQYLEHSLAISQEQFNLFGIGKCHQFLGELLAQLGDVDAARAAYKEAERIFEMDESPEVKDVKAYLEALDMTDSPTEHSTDGS